MITVFDLPQGVATMLRHTALHLPYSTRRYGGVAFPHIAPWPIKGAVSFFRYRPANSPNPTGPQHTDEALGRYGIIAFLSDPPDANMAFRHGLVFSGKTLIPFIFGRAVLFTTDEPHGVFEGTGWGDRPCNSRLTYQLFWGTPKQPTKAPQTKES